MQVKVLVFLFIKYLKNVEIKLITVLKTWITFVEYFNIFSLVLVYKHILIVKNFMNDRAKIYFDYHYLKVIE